MQNTIEGFRLSPQQDRLWHLQQYSQAYWAYCSVEITGPLQETGLYQALHAICARHEALRTHFRRLPGMTAPIQVIASQAQIIWYSYDLQEAGVDERQQVIEKLARMAFEYPLDVESEPLLHATLLTLEKQRHLFWLSVPSLLADRRTLQNLFNELIQYYTVNQAGEAYSSDAEDVVQYVQFSEWQHSLLEDDDVTRQQAIDNDFLSSFFTHVNLPFMTTKLQPERYTPANYAISVDPLLRANLSSWLEQHTCSLPIFMVSCWSALLGRLCECKELALGVQVDGRLYEDLVSVAGQLEKILPFLCQIEDSLPFMDFLAQVGESYGQLLSQYPTFSVQTLQNLTQHEANAALSMFGFACSELPLAYQTGELTFNLRESICYSEPFGLCLTVLHRPDEICLQWQYHADVLSAAAVQQIAEHFLTLLQSVLNQERTPLRNLPLLSVAQQRSLLDEFALGPQEELPEGELLEIIVRQAARTPDVIAVEDSQGQMSYQVLLQAASRLAQRLQMHQIGPERLVGVYQYRRTDLLVSLLAILQAGGAYVPLEPHLPPQRLQWMVQQANVSCLLTSADLLQTLPALDAVEILLVEDELRTGDSEEYSLQSAVGQFEWLDKRLAYVMYTSGSTGKPKGVMISLQGLTNYICWASSYYQVADGAGAPVHSSLAFDLTVTSLFTPLVAGKRVVLAEEASGIEALSQLLRQRGKQSLVKLTPAHLELLNQELSIAEKEQVCNALIIGGESLSAVTVQEWRRAVPEIRLINEYGPTEAVVGCCIYEVPEGLVEEGNVPIGRPIPRTQLYVLDQHQQPVPAGMAGELYIGGSGVARGYLGQPALTAERFLPHPFVEQPGERLYRTGDLVRYKDELGTLEYLGRVDRQVKLRGYRIELGEIEIALHLHPQVREVAVLLREDVPGQPQLVAYIVTQQASSPGLQDVRDFLQPTLPEYMLPTAVILLNVMPLTVNGKPDRLALPAPTRDNTTLPSYTSPRSPIEAILVEIWKEVLNVSSVSVHDNFFHLGGHSLLATQCLIRLRRTFHCELPLHYLFDAPTVAELAVLVEQMLQREQGIELPPLVAALRSAPLPLSFAQQRLWFLNQLEPESTAYLIPFIRVLTGSLDVVVLERSFHELMQRHESLRTTFELQANQPVQIIHEIKPFQLPVVDLSDLEAALREYEVTRLATQEAQQPFHLDQYPLIRTCLLRLDKETHVLLLTLHHIITDAWSNGILYRELRSLYQAFTAGLLSPLPPLAIQYADYALWQRQWLQDKVIDEQVSYWREYLAEAQTLQLPTDYQRPVRQSYRGAHYSIQLPSALSQQLRQLSQQNDITLFMTLLAAFQVLLMRYSGQTDISVGTPIANRAHHEVEGLIGFFVNTLVLRGDLSDNPTFSELLVRTRESTLGAYTHQDIPFEYLVDAIQPERDLSCTPLFQVMFALEQEPASDGKAETEQEKLTFRGLAVEDGTSKFDLSLFVQAREDALHCGIEYSTDLFCEQSIERLLQHWRILLEGVIEQPESRLSELPFLTNEERQGLLIAWNDTQVDYTQNMSFCQVFAAQVQRTPDAIALSDEHLQISYHELHQQSDQLAAILQAHGVELDVLVGVCAERSPMMAVSILAILKAGGAYLPLDPRYPRERLEFVLADAQVQLILTTHELSHLLSASDATLLYLDERWQVPDPLRKDFSRNEGNGEQLAYIIYTSGSTGRPKGVMVREAGMLNHLFAKMSALHLAEGDVVAQTASHCFDISVWQFLAGLLAGSRVQIINDDIVHDPFLLLQEIVVKQISILELVPSLLRLLLDEVERTENIFSLQGILRWIVVTGEALSSQQYLRWVQMYPHIPLLNGYGPTECSDNVTHALIAQAISPSQSNLSIGRALPNLQIYLLDTQLNPVPVGAVGQIYVGGIGVGRGYLGNPLRTAEVFIPDPYGLQAGGRLYRTGDLGFYLADGQIQFLGRADAQVKVRGYRIEPGEIEACLNSYPAVREAVVNPWEELSGRKRLVAYMVALPSQALTIKELRSYLKEKLPDYMIPADFVLLETLPLTPNGKVNRRGLPAPDAERLALNEAYAAPRTTVERTLAQIWAQTLKRESIGIYDNFFSLGGDSILSIQVIARANQQGIHLTTRQLFQHQTIAQLANVATTLQRPLAQQTSVTGSVPLTPIQDWFLSQTLQERHHYNQSRILALEEKPSPTSWQNAIGHVMQQHDALRMRFVYEPAGWRQYHAELLPDVPFVYIDFSALPEESHLSALETLATAAQASLNLESGPVMRCLFVDRGIQYPGGYLLWIIHHLVVDGVSWRILLADLEAALLSTQQRTIVQLPAKTTSFQAWSEQLSSYASSETMQQELSYWLAPTRQVLTGLPIDIEGGENTVASRSSINVQLTAEETQALLEKVPQVYHTQINDVLLTALTQVLGVWMGQRQLLVDLEGHGREEIWEDLDLSRTVGWFTTLFPVLLDIEQARTQEDALKLVKEQLRHIPQHGIGYGLLRYLHPDAQVREKFAMLPSAQVSFNYLGQFDQMYADLTQIQRTPVSAGPTQSQLEQRTHQLEINGSVVGGQLRFAWQYSQHIHLPQTIQRLATNFIEQLRKLIAYCLAPGAGGYTPTDFPLASLDQERLDWLVQFATEQGPDGQKQQIEDIYPLSPMQSGLLFHSLYAPDSSVYYGQFGWTIQGDIDIVAWRKAWELAVSRHPVLRTAFFWQQLEHPLQIVYQHVELPWTFEDWSGLPELTQRQRLASIYEADREYGFKLSSAPLLRLYLVHLKDDNYYFLHSFHHLLQDGWSHALLVREVQAYYHAYCQKQEPLLPSPRPYRDYIAWMLQQDAQPAEQFWRTYLAGFISPTILGLDLQSGVIDAPSSQELAVKQWWLARETTITLQKLAQQHQLTMNTIIQGAWALLLSRYSSENDVVFGATVAGRPAELAGVESMVGLFINTLPVRVQVNGDIPLVTWLSELQAQQVEARQYEYTPLVDIQRWSEIAPPQQLFESLLLFQNFPGDDGTDTHDNKRQESSLKIHADSVMERTNYPLCLAIAVVGAAVSIELTYDKAHFSEDAVLLILEHLRLELESMSAHWNERLVDLPLLGEKEQELILRTWNHPPLELSQELGLHALVLAQVERTPERIAVWDEDGQLTYGALEQAARQLASVLRAHGVAQETLVALCLPHTSLSLIAMLATLLAGGAYVPLDPASPPERLEQLCARLDHPLIVTTFSLRPVLAQVAAPLLLLDEAAGAWRHASPLSSEAVIDPEQLAYVIFTSGSTGVPKGVAISHRNGVHSTTARLLAYEEAVQSYLLLSPFFFDSSVAGLYWTLAQGGRLVLPGAEGLTHLERLPALLEQQQVSHLLCIPGLYEVMLEEGDPQHLQSLRQVIVAGERCPAGLLQTHRRRLPQTRFANEYGPTEGTVWCSVSQYSAGSALPQDVVPIGTPIATSELYVLDETGHLVPPGVVGGLYLGGPGVARGYLAEAEATAQQFVPHPFSLQAGARLYRTGDRGRYRSDGALLYEGRVDGQVKVRGHRVELGEIEALIGRHELVREVVVTVGTGAGAGLVGYVVMREGQDVARVERWAQEHLLDYMVPARWMPLEALPRTATGKVDRQHLPVPQERAPQVRRAGSGGPLEEWITQVWQEVLGREEIGRDENFFALGGHSLLATRVISRLRRQMGREIALRSLFEAPTVRGLTQRVEQVVRGVQREEPRLRRRPSGERVPLSYGQQRLWFLEQLEPGNVAYLIPSAQRISGTLQIEALERSVQRLQQRHEILRTRFEEDGQEVWQVIAEEVSARITVIDVQGVAETQVRRLMQEEAMQPCDLRRGPLWRVWVVREGAQEQTLLLTMHHSIADGGSMQVLERELLEGYEAYVQGKEPEWRALEVQYADYALWQREWLQGEMLDTQLAYWMRQLADVPSLELPTDYLRPPIKTFNGAVRATHLPVEIRDGLVRIGQHEGVTLFMVALAAFQILLMRYTGQTDISVGTPIANRTRSELEDLIGFFVNTLVLRVDLAGNPSFRELLQRMRETALGAYAHQDIPFEQLVEVLQPERDISRSPIFQIFFVMQYADENGRASDAVRIHRLGVEHTATKFDLTCTLTSHADGMTCHFAYNTDLFSAATIERMLGHWRVLLESIIDHSQLPIGDLQLLAPTDLQRMQQWNETRRDYMLHETLHACFERQVQRTPDAIALVYEDEYLSYATLNRCANQLAYHLRQQGATLEIPIGICLERSLQSIIAVLAVLKAGGMYVPLDAASPAERLILIAQDAHLAMVITRSTLITSTIASAVPCIYLDQDWSYISQYSAKNPGTSIESANAAYVLYTSGSTGVPKGVVVEHRQVLNYVASIRETAELRDGAAYAMLQPLTVDSCLTMLFPSLHSGGVLHLIEQNCALDPQSLARYCREHPIDYLKIAPSHLAALLVDTSSPEILPQRGLIIGGEASQQEWVQQLSRFMSPGAVYNHYGPTETTVGSLACRITATENHQRGVTPIGWPLANTEVYVLDNYLGRVPVGVVGELYIGGFGLTRGYLNRAEVTAERFIPHLFSDRAGERLYKTGDLVRYRDDGQIEFVGRNDDQVKVRGFRIELGEIETTLKSHPAVADALVLAINGASESTQVVACVAARPATVITRQELLTFLRTRLPEYMVPTAYHWLEALPRTLHGKIDRKAALSIVSTASVKEDIGEAPRDAIEEIIAEIWKQVLHSDDIGIHDDFFALGGHSLLATQMISRLRAILEIHVPLRNLFEFPTISRLAQQVTLQLRQGHEVLPPPLVPVKRSEPFPLSFAQQRLWFLYKLDPLSTAYLIPGVRRLRGPLDIKSLERSLWTLMLRHECLRTTFHECHNPTELVRMGQPVQVIEHVSSLRIPVIDLSSLTYELREREVKRLIGQEAQHPFQLDQSPLLRISLLRRDIQEHVMLFTMHHIISDGWSMQLFFQEATALYGAYVQGQTVQLPDLPIQYADYAVWQRQWMQGEVLEAHIGYWRRQLAGIQALKLPLDHLRPARPTQRGAAFTFTLSVELSQALIALSREEGGTPFMTLLAAFQALLYRYTGQMDIALGTDSANRNRLETEGLIGFFINLLVLRTSLKGNPSFRELLKRVREVVLGAYTYQEAPFDLLVEKLAPDHSLDRMPLVQALFVMQNLPVLDAQDLATATAPGLQPSTEGIQSPVEDEARTSKFDLALFMFERERQFHGLLNYSLDVFEGRTIELLISRFLTLLQSTVQHPETTLDQLDFLTGAEQQQQQQEEQKLRGELHQHSGERFDLSSFGPFGA